MGWLFIIGILVVIAFVAATSIGMLGYAWSTASVKGHSISEATLKAKKEMYGSGVKQSGLLLSAPRG